MKLKWSHVLGFFFTLILGTLLHFTDEWSGQNPWVATFSSVNESVWEHLKLFIVPILIFSVYEYIIYGKNTRSFAPAKLLGILAGMMMIVIGFYTYTAVLGTHYLWADIALFVLGSLMAWMISYALINHQIFSSKMGAMLGLIGLLMLISVMVYFTFYPPHLELFCDPSSGGYGRVKS